MSAKMKAPKETNATRVSETGRDGNVDESGMVRGAEQYRGELIRCKYEFQKSQKIKSCLWLITYRKSFVKRFFEKIL